MVTKVAGMWELGWSAPITEFDLWHLMLRDFDVDEWIMSPVTGIDRPVSEVGRIELAIGQNPELVPVFVDENGNTDLHAFEHPRHALYLFGKATYSPFTALAGSWDKSVRIETPMKAGLLWPHQAAAIVLYDRWAKSWQ